MNRAYLLNIFNDLQNEHYAVVKFDADRMKEKGADIDIYCENISTVGKKILAIGNELLLKDTVSRIKVTEDKKQKHVYIDFFVGSELDFRFDLFGRLPQFEKIHVQKELFQQVLYSRIEKHGTFVPDESLDLLIRYVEYIEYYPERPSKIKHLTYVSKSLENEEVRKLFFQALGTFVLKNQVAKKVTHPLIRKLRELPKRVMRKVWKILH